MLGGSSVGLGDLDETVRISEFVAARFTLDRDALMVAVPHGEKATDVDKALAWGLVLQGDADLHVVLPAQARGADNTPAVEATLTRCAFIRTPVRVWTYEPGGQPIQHVIPPKHVALASTRKDDEIPASTYDLGARAEWVTSLEAKADAELTPAHTNRSV